jgi:hypothetical protein
MPGASLGTEPVPGRGRSRPREVGHRPCLRSAVRVGAGDTVDEDGIQRPPPPLVGTLVTSLSPLMAPRGQLPAQPVPVMPLPRPRSASLSVLPLTLAAAAYLPSSVVAQFRAADSLAIASHPPPVHSNVVLPATTEHWRSVERATVLHGGQTAANMSSSGDTKQGRLANAHRHLEPGRPGLRMCARLTGRNGPGAPGVIIEGRT